MPRAFEARPDHPAIHTLVRLHADLGAQIQQNKERGDKLADDMRAVEAVIRLFDPAYDVRRIAVKRRRLGNPFYKRGECFRHALDVLRVAETPLTSREVVRLMLAKIGVPEPTNKQVRTMLGAVHRGLENHNGKSVTRSAGMPARWALCARAARVQMSEGPDGRATSISS